MTLKKLFCSCVYLFLLLGHTIHAQDLRARVQILSPEVQATNKRVFDVLQRAISDFLNNRKWSEQTVATQERIDCNLVITVKDWDGSSNYQAEAQIVSTRPVYNSAYNSPVLSMSDKNFNFTYMEGDPLDYSDQQYLSNLTSLLAYYAYMIVGMDADTFSPNGGSPYYILAQQVVTNAQTSNTAGWKSIESLDNRFWLANNMLDQNFKPLRDFAYAYHMEVLDQLVDNPTASRKKMLELLPLLKRVDRMAQGAIYNQLFYTAKAEELAGILSGFSGPEKMNAINILSEADPAHIHQYEALKNL